MFESLLRKIDHFVRLSDAERQALVGCFKTTRSFLAGQEVLPQFSTPESSTLVVSGWVGRLVTQRAGGQQLTALQVPGDFIDLHGFLLQRLDHSVTALAECRVAIAPHGELRRIMDDYPRVARALWFLTTIDAAIHRRWLAVLGGQRAGARAAHLICELYLRLADVSLAEDGGFRMPLSQAQFASALFVTTVHGNRVVQALRRRGLIEWNGEVLKILDWEALSSLGEFDPTYLQLAPPSVAPPAREARLGADVS